MATPGMPPQLPALMSYGYFIVSIFHNVANQISQLQCELQQVAPLLPLHSYRELQHQLSYVADVVRHSQEILKRDTPILENIRVNRLFWETKRLCNLLLIRQCVRCQITCPDSLVLRADPIILKQILLNLLHNSLQAMEHVPLDQRVVTLRSFATPHGVVIEVSDQGSGVALEMVSQVGEPFQTTGYQGAGHGLGLAYVTHHMRQSFGGRCQVLSQPGEGTTVRLMFPPTFADVGQPPDSALQ